MEPGARPVRKRLRLDLQLYGQPDRVCSITMAVKGRQPVFEHPQLATAVVKLLEDLAAEHGIPVYAYCVMPDHVHLVVSASASCDILTFVGRFKSLALRAAWSQGIRGTFWQRSFWDHFVRDDEDLAQVIGYVLANPVRAGLVDEPSAYAFSGSLTPVR